jgi:hypothetical protein
VTTPREPYRVIQWGTGAVGAEMIIAILDGTAGLELVGAKVYSAAKHGSDVGTLVGRDPVGVLATADTAEIIAMPADCVLYTPRTTDLDEVSTILASGKNVATTAFLFHPRRLPAPDRDRVLAACEQGGTSVHGSGLNPGNLSGVLPLALSGMSRTSTRSPCRNARTGRCTPAPASHSTTWPSAGPSTRSAWRPTRSWRSTARSSPTKSGSCPMR